MAPRTSVSCRRCSWGRSTRRPGTACADASGRRPTIHRWHCSTPRRGPAPTRVFEAEKERANENHEGTDFPFELDPFQLEAARAIDEGESVLVTAPTGAGKTAIAEVGVRLALSRGLRAIYTTPVKALSNQKFHEFRSTFGEGAVGLITGDVKIRPDADVIVMTTEILRNILYTELGSGSEPEGEKTRLDFSRVQAVVLDEVHYMGDEERGTVWEETIIYLGSEHLRHIQLISLSATLANAEEISAWMRQTRRQPVKLVRAESRPVPLTLFWTLRDLESDRAELQPVYRIDDAGNGVIASEFMKSLSQLKEPAPDFRSMLLLLRKQKMLPCIWFIFKRSACDQAARRAYKTLAKRPLLKQRERALLAEMMDELRRSHPESVKHDLVKPFLCGIASHHAGLLPSWKGLVESAFKRGLVKVVFATHTLALGINMPAKTVVISELETRRGPGYGRGVLTHNEIFQLAGRAGRRGYDETGNCVLLNSPNVSLQRVLKNLMQGPAPVDSSFTAGYGMVLNLISTLGYNRGKEMMKSSFKNFQCQAKAASETAGGELRRAAPTTSPAVRKLEQRLSAQVRVLRALVGQTQAARGALVEDLYLEGELPLPCLAALDEEGESLGQGDGSGLTPCVILEVTEAGEFLCCGEKRLFRVEARHVAAVGEEVPGETFQGTAALASGDLRWKRSSQGFFSAAHKLQVDVLRNGWGDTLAFVGVDQETESAIRGERRKLTEIRRELDALRLSDFDFDGGEGLQEIEEWLGARGQRFDDRFKAQEKELEASWRYSLEDTVTGIIAQTEDVSLAEARRGSRSRMLGLLKNAESYERVVKEFDGRVRVLCEIGALDERTLELRPLGRVAAQIKAENELWIATCVTGSEIFMLTSKELAGFACALILRDSLRLHSNVECTLPASEALYRSLEGLEPKWDTLVELQVANGVDQAPFVDARLSGLAEHWADGATWQQVRDSVDLDEGDIVKILHRTQDLLRQVGGLDLVPEELRRTARQAADSFQRSPLTDLL